MLKTTLAVLGGVTLVGVVFTAGFICGAAGVVATIVEELVNINKVSK